MRTNILTLTVSLLLLGGGFVACDDPEPIKAIGTSPVSAPENVSAFFKTHLPPKSSSPLEVAFFGKIDFDDTECFVINSMEEFKTVAPTAVELPVIDFEKYTLIIGRHWFGDPGYSFEAQAVDAGSDEMTLNLVYKNLKGAHSTDMAIFYFWGLYTKLPEKTIAVNITII